MTRTPPGVFLLLNFNLLPESVMSHDSKAKEIQ